jgi:hypothetical protein
MLLAIQRCDTGVQRMVRGLHRCARHCDNHIAYEFIERPTLTLNLRHTRIEIGIQQLTELREWHLLREADVGMNAREKRRLT